MIGNSGHKFSKKDPNRTIQSEVVIFRDHDLLKMRYMPVCNYIQIIFTYFRSSFHFLGKLVAQRL